MCIRDSYTAIADAVELPIILYNVPSRTGVDIKPETIAKLAEHPRIVAVKEANGNISAAAQVAALCDIDIYSGNDDQIVPLLSLGSKGVISVLSNILPQQTHDICAKWFAGDAAGSRALQLKYLESVSYTHLNFVWYLFCGFCLALSVIAPGMSFSTLLMPLGLYTPFVDGIGHLDMGVLIPGGLGALITVILLAKAVNALFDRHYSLAFHAIIGIVIAATVMIIPYQSFTVSMNQSIVNLVCLACLLYTSYL